MCVYVCVCVCMCVYVCVCVCMCMCWSQFQSNKGDWSSGMIPALGAGGREFDSRITPFCW
jgi:hypothetical protein